MEVIVHTRDGWREQLGSRPPCEWTEPEGVQGDDPPLPCGMRLGPGVRAAGSRVVLPRREGAP